MIITGIFLFLLGAKIDEASAVNADVKYEPSKITIKEQIDQTPVVIPESGSPNFVHQGSNYFFGAPFLGPSGFLPQPQPPGRIEVTEEDIIFAKPHVGKYKPPYTNPVITVNGKEVIQYPKFSLPFPNVSLNIQPGTFLSPISGPFNSHLIPQLPLSPWNIPGMPIVSKAPYVSTPIERPIHLPNEVVISEVDVLVKEIPPPPQLPPLKLEDIFKPVVVEEKKIILVPSPPEIEAVLPPSIILADQPCPPSLCARNIIFERVLPNIACERSKKIEFISIPASMKHPVVTKSFLPYVIKH